MKKEEFKEFLPAFFESLFKLWVNRDNFPNDCNLVEETGMTKIYQYPITDSTPRNQGGKQQLRGESAVNEQQKNFRPLKLTENTQLRVLISRDSYVVVDLSDEASNRERRYMAIKVITREGINQLEVTGLNYPDQNNRYRSGCSARDLLRFMEITNPKIIPKRWHNADTTTRVSYMNDEFLNSNNYKTNDPDRALNEEIISKEILPLSRNTNFKFYFPLINDLRSEDDIQNNIDYYKRIQFGEIVYVPRYPLEERATSNLFKYKAIRMSTPKGMGKTMLLKHIILPQIRSRNYQAVTFNCAVVNSSMLNNYDEFFQWFLTTISIDALSHIKKESNVNDINNEVHHEIDQRWKENPTNSNADSFLTEYLLPQIPNGLVIAFEKIDVILERSNFDNDLIPLLRTWWDNAKDSSQPNWKKLHLVLLNSSEVYAKRGDDFSPDIGISLGTDFRDFNQEIGENGELTNEVSRFINIQELNFELNQDQITSITNLIGGSPYLFSKLIQRLKDNVEIEIQNRKLKSAQINTIVKSNLDNILDTAITITGIYKQHFEELLAILNNNNNIDMKNYFTMVVHSDSPMPLEDTYHFKLNSLGLINYLENNLISVKNELYRLFFRSVLPPLD